VVREAPAAIRDVDVSRQARLHPLLLDLRGVVGDVPLVRRIRSKVRNGQPWAFSFDIADRCPIGCDCYWAAQTRVQELDLPQVVQFFLDRREEGMVHVTLVGGEPYVRPDVLAAVTPIMPVNWLVTSGTTPLRRFPNTTHFISIDGADAATHNAVRRSKNLFERILRNLDRARSTWPSFPAYIHSVLNAQNFWQADDIVDFWRATGLADGVMFSTHTPIEGGNDEHLRLTRAQRTQLVDDLLRCRRTHGRFVLNTPHMLRSLLPDRTGAQTPETCTFAASVTSYRADGGRKNQCIFGEDADCTNCGCAVTTLMDAVIVNRNFATMRMLGRLRDRGGR
jgi:MoaA/NifB/PqqE/SkfB family radical SAM enzyme